MTLPWETETTPCSLAVFAGKKAMYLPLTSRNWPLAHTRERLEKENAAHNYELILDSHANMGNYAAPMSVSCIVFNFGYLPGGDHSLATRPDSSILALQASLGLLKKGRNPGCCAFISGGDSGFEERDALLSWLKKLDSRNIW